MWRVPARLTLAAMTTVSPDRRTALLMGFVAATLGIMSALHFAGTFRGETDAPAGIPELIIGGVLVAGAMALLRNGDSWAAVAALGFATAGFLLGLTITIERGAAVEVAYHAAALPALVFGFALATRRARTGDGGRAGCRRGR
jgi:hypothetical protein